MVEVTIIGSSGRIGRALVAMLAVSNFEGTLHLVARNTRAVEGLVSDVHSVKRGLALQLYGMDDERPIEKSELIVVVAGETPRLSLRTECDHIDPGGRYAQAAANIDLMTGIGRLVADVKRDVAVLVVTNQSDLLAGLLRERFGLQNVYGFGNMLDSYRLRAALSSQSASIVGFHIDRYMVAVSATIEKDLWSRLPRGISEVRKTGSDIAAAYKHGERPQEQQTGAVFGPALCLFRCIRTFCGLDDAFVESFNRLSSTPDFDHPSKIGLGLPTRVARRVLQPLDGFIDLTEFEMLDLVDAQQHMSRLLARLIVK